MYSHRESHLQIYLNFVVWQRGSTPSHSVVLSEGSGQACAAALRSGTGAAAAAAAAAAAFVVVLGIDAFLVGVLVTSTYTCTVVGIPSSVIEKINTWYKILEL